MALYRPHVLFHATVNNTLPLKPNAPNKESKNVQHNPEDPFWLYAYRCSSRAVTRGLTAVLLRQFDVQSVLFDSEYTTLYVDSQKKISREDLQEIDLYLYTFRYAIEHRWRNLEDFSRAATGDYRTQNFIDDRYVCAVTKISMRDWLMDRCVRSV